MSLKSKLYRLLELTMSAFFVTKDGEELTHSEMTQQLMQRVTQVEDSNKLLQHQILSLVERLNYIERR